MADGLVIERRLPASADVVWSHLTNVDRLPEWLGQPVRVDARIGGVVAVDHGDSTVCVSEVLECDATAHLLTVTWELPDEPVSHVGIEIVTVDDSASTLQLAHDGLGEVESEYRAGWRTHLTFFEASLAGEPLSMSEFWDVHSRLT